MQKQIYYKYTRTLRGGWRKEEIKQRVYPLKIGEFDLIVLRNEDCWEVREASTYIGLITGYSQLYKTRKSIIKETEKLISSLSERKKTGGLLYAAEWKIKFERLPVDVDVDNISELLTQDDHKKLSDLYNSIDLKKAV